MLKKHASITHLKDKLSARPFWHRGLHTVWFCFLIAGAITAATPQPFRVNLVYSELIGLSIWFLIDAGRHLIAPNGWPSPGKLSAWTLVSALTGYVIGSALGDWILGMPLLHGFRLHTKEVTAYLLISIASAVFGTFVFASREKLGKAQEAALTAQRQAAESQLKLLESQLEPHMLFNTLANLRALIGTDPARATEMLDHMVAYLRATLGGSRTAMHPLSLEFDRLRDYLELMTVRMGPRLTYTLDLPPELAHHPVPPLLLQPLVENAIKHGLEPKVEGGSIKVQARLEGDKVVLEVSDTGVGGVATLRETQGQGFGLSQVAERLATTYGSLSAIYFVANEAYSTSARVVFPYLKQHP